MPTPNHPEYPAAHSCATAAIEQEVILCCLYLDLERGSNISGRPIRAYMVELKDKGWDWVPSSG